MDLHHLRTFVVVAEERSFTKAAARLHISQPPLSRHIRQLEDMLGVQLLARNRQRVDLTTEGRLLLAKARAVIDGSEDILNAAKQLRVGSVGTVTMGLASGLWSVALTIRARYAASCARITLDVADIGPGADPLVTQAVDVSLVRGESHNRSLMRHRLFDERIVVMLPESHPLAGRSSVTMLALAGEIVATTTSVVSDRVLELYSRAGAAPAGTIDCPVDVGIDAVRMLVASGRAVGFSVESPWTDSARVAGIATVRLEGPEASIPVYLSWRKDEQSQSVLSLVDCGRRAFVNGLLQPMPNRTAAPLNRTGPDVHVHVPRASSQRRLEAQKLAVC
jgi:DNA-binding transcriptional LysR family regulator